MAYEICQDSNVCFNFKFLHTTDFITWVSIGTQYDNVHYAACPMIRYAGGMYYITFLSHFQNDVFATQIIRSANLDNFEGPTSIVL